MKDTIKDYLITAFISLFTGLLGIYGDEIKVMINNKLVRIIDFLPLILIVLLLVYYICSKKKLKHKIENQKKIIATLNSQIDSLKDQIKKQDSQNVFLKENTKSLEGHIKRLESSIGQSSNFDQAKRIIEDYHKNKELIFYTVSLVELLVDINGSSIDNNVYDAHYTWTIKGRADKAIDDTILNDFIVSISSSDNIEKQTLNLEVERCIDDFYMSLDPTQYNIEERSKTEYALHIPYGRCLEKGNTFIFKVHYDIKNGFKAPLDKFQFTPSNCKYGKVEKFKFYIRSNLPLFHIATFKRENIDQNTELVNRSLSQQGEKLYELSYEIDCKEYESITVKTYPV